MIANIVVTGRTREHAGVGVHGKPRRRCNERPVHRIAVHVQCFVFNTEKFVLSCGRLILRGYDEDRCRKPGCDLRVARYVVALTPRIVNRMVWTGVTSPPVPARIDREAAVIRCIDTEFGVVVDTRVMDHRVGRRIDQYPVPVQGEAREAHRIVIAGKDEETGPAVLPRYVAEDAGVV